MTSISGVSLLLKRELKEVFRLPTLYYLTALFFVTMGFLFFSLLMNKNPLSEASANAHVIQPLFNTISSLMVFISLLISMRSFVVEKSQQTLDYLFTCPFSNLDILLAKWFSCLVQLCFILLPTVIFPIILHIQGLNIWNQVASIYFGLLLCMMAYTSVGIFASSITSHQIASAVIGFCIIMSFVILSYTSGQIQNMMVAQIFQYMSLPYHFLGFLAGSIKSYSLIYYTCFCTLFLFLGHQALSMRRWL